MVSLKSSIVGKKLILVRDKLVNKMLARDKIDFL